MRGAPRSRAIPIRFGESEWEAIKAASEHRHEYASSYCRRVVLTELDRQQTERTHGGDSGR